MNRDDFLPPNDLLSVSVSNQKMCPDLQKKKKRNLVLYLFHFNVLGAVHHCHIDRRWKKTVLSSFGYGPHSLIQTNLAYGSNNSQMNLCDIPLICPIL